MWIEMAQPKYNDENFVRAWRAVSTAMNTFNVAVSKTIQQETSLQVFRDESLKVIDNAMEEAEKAATAPPRFKKGDVVRVTESGVLRGRVGRVGGYFPGQLCAVEWPDGGITSFAENALVLETPNPGLKRPKSG